MWTNFPDRLQARLYEIRCHESHATPLKGDLVKLGNWQLDVVSGGTFRIDGGVMFGVVPRSLWQHVVTPDFLNRIDCATNCVLARNGQQTVLLDTGYGGKFNPLDRKFYALEAGDPLLRSLARLGLTEDDIDLVVLSHLHFDHVGGATRFDRNKNLVPTFPRARHVIGRWEWQDAMQQTAELKTAYPLENFLPLKEKVAITLVDDNTEITPGLRARVTGGHTRGHLAFWFESQGKTAMYIGDICPSSIHVRRMWCLAYDVYPLETRRLKPRLLGEAADKRWWIFWSHDPTVPMSRVFRDNKRDFVLTDEQPHVTGASGSA